MIGDVGKAEKMFITLLGGESKVAELLKRADAAEAQRLRGKDMVTYLTTKFSNMGFKPTEAVLFNLFRERGVVYLLSTRPHTNSNSNFVKLVANNVKRFSAGLINGLRTPGLMDENDRKNLESVKKSLTRYLKLIDKTEDDIIPEDHTTITSRLRRKKNKDLAEKMQSRRKVNRLKVIVTAFIIYLIEKVENVREVMDKLGNGTATVDEYMNVDASIFSSLKDLTIPEGVTKIRYSTRGFTNLTSVTIPGTVNEIDIGAFEECTNLREVDISYGVQCIGNWAFYCCNLKSVMIPGSVKLICFAAFRNCTSLEELVIEHGVEEIKDGAFSNCKKLRTISVPESVISIRRDAFKDCPWDMNIEGDASEEIKNIIRNQIKAE